MMERMLVSQRTDGCASECAGVRAGEQMSVRVSVRVSVCASALVKESIPDQCSNGLTKVRINRVNQVTQSGLV